MKKLFKLLLCTLCVALVLTCLAACGKTYGVTFNAGESDGYVVTVKKGSKAIPPAVECADGVYVEGWYDNEQRTGEKFDFDKEITEDVTLWAKLQARFSKRATTSIIPTVKIPRRWILPRTGT